MLPKRDMPVGAGQAGVSSIVLAYNYELIRCVSNCMFLSMPAAVMLVFTFIP